MMLSFLVRQISEVETNIVSMERVKEYTHTPQEAEWYNAKKPPTNWPHSGEISIQNLCCRYRPELKLSLRNITANIHGREKIGVVGRTGSGKTSLSLAIFRIIEPTEGQIFIDGTDICTIGLHELRSRITVIPQDPVLFSGTLRFNLDPFSVSTDAELWTALEHAHLLTFVETQREGLSHQIAEGGNNISVGQRQLICLARAILRRSAVIVLDEATASIDPSTDALIQKTIRNEFVHSTVITIAHRISTILDYDRIMVLELGRLVEFDTPKNLLADKRSMFANLVASLENSNTQI